MIERLAWHTCLLDWVNFWIESQKINHLSVKNILSSSNFQNIFSNCVRMHHYASFFKNVLSNSTFKEHRFKLCENVPLSILVLNSVKMHHLASLLSHFSQQFQLQKHCFRERTSPSHHIPISINFILPTLCPCC